ncbi:MAG: argininosuccinate lyase [Clostridiales bacterium]|nr:argininosuccinate lyase [Clostridiales bacterium]
MKLWSGRFSKDTDKLTNDFNSSISFDYRLYKFDILGSIAHAKMLGKCNIISSKDSEKIIAGLNEILIGIENETIEFDSDAEDIHMFIESLLISKIGEAGKKLHTGRSRNDQVALDTRMYVKDEINKINELVVELRKTIVTLADQHTESFMSGYTHLQKAQPTTLAHHLMAYYEMFKRDNNRLDDIYKRTDSMPLGSGAMATTTYKIDRQMVCDLLEFSSLTENSMDSVSDRDYVLELLFAISLIMMHLSRLSEEIILWTTKEFSYIELDDAFSTGSSIMPQKKNPDIAELVRGKTGRVYGNLITMLSIMKALPMAYNKDMQEDKPALFDSIDNVKISLSVFTKMLETSTFNKENLLNNALSGFTNATDLADYLVKKGIPFRTSHEITGKIVAYCILENKTIEQLSLLKLQKFSDKIKNDVYEAISIETCVNNRDVVGGPARIAVSSHIKKAKDQLNS